MAGKCGTLKIQALRGASLRNVQMIGQQDPYVVLTLLPWGEKARTKASKGTNPVWNPQKHNSTMFLHYPGKPVPPLQPELSVEVYDAEYTQSDRLIGKSKINIRPNLTKYEEHEVAVELEDEDGFSAGRLYLSFDFVLMGAIEITALEACGLRDVHYYIGQQDPYVRVRLNTTGQVARTKASSGTYPKWNEEKYNPTMLLDFPGMPSEPDAPEPAIEVEVWDAELVGSDRIIAKAVRPIQVENFLTCWGHGESKNVSLELMDPELGDSGHLKLKVRFLNEAYSEDKEIVRNGAGEQPSFQNLQQSYGNSTSILETLERMYHMVVSAVRKSRLLLYLEGQTGIPRGYAASGGGSLLLVSGILLWSNLGTQFITTCVGVIYPVYKSFQALESDIKDDDTMWLTYWISYSVMHLLELSVLAPLIRAMPSLFFLLKMLVLLWMLSPVFNGAMVIYRYFLRPFLRRHEREIDAALLMSEATARSGMERLRAFSENENEDERENGTEVLRRKRSSAKGKRSSDLGYYSR